MDTEDGSDDREVSLDVPVKIVSSTHFDLIYTPRASRITS